MKKILLLPIFVSFFFDIGVASGDVACDSIVKTNYELDSKGNLTDEGASQMEIDCNSAGCAYSLGSCVFCTSGNYGNGGRCQSCGDLTYKQNYGGYWNYSDNGATQKAGSCYAKCSEHKPAPTIPNGYWYTDSTRVYYKATSLSVCKYEIYCNSNYYIGGYNGTTYYCSACSDLSITRNGQTYTGYWTTGPGGGSSVNSSACSASCTTSLPTPETGVATYEKSAVTYPNECIPKTCQNSTNKCEGYKLVTPYSCPNDYVLIPTLSTAGGTDGAICEYRDFVSKKTIRIAATKGTKGCFRYTQEQTNGLPTGATKGYTILNETSGTYPTLRIYECSAGYHLQTPVKTDGDHCTGRKYGTCISDTGKCNADLLDCTGGSTNTISGTNITWNADKEDWNANTGCKCVSTGVTLYNDTGNEIGTATITKTYASGDKNNGNTKWNDAEINVTRCILGYAAQDGTCKPVKDGQYSADNDPVAHECSNVEVCLQNGGVCSNPVTNYYKHSNLPRESADNCYAKCSERVADLNAKSGNNGTWRLQSGAATTVTRKIGSLCQVELSCKAQYYRYARLDMSVEAQKCKSCSELTDSDSKTDYWNKSDGGTGDETSCYALCNDSDKKPTTDNGEFTAGASKVNYNATTKAKCTYTLGCKAGFYTNSDGETCGACPAGSTSDAGSTDIKQCYMKGGSDGTLFCDKHGCFNLPTGVQIFYAGD